MPYIFLLYFSFPCRNRKLELNISQRIFIIIIICFLSPFFPVSDRVKLEKEAIRDTHWETYCKEWVCVWLWDWLGKVQKHRAGHPEGQDRTLKHGLKLLPRSLTSAPQVFQLTESGPHKLPRTTSLTWSKQSWTLTTSQIFSQ